MAKDIKPVYKYGCVIIPDEYTTFSVISQFPQGVK